MFRPGSAAMIGGLAGGGATPAREAASHPFDGSFDDAASAVEIAIVGRGLVIDDRSHVGEMLAPAMDSAPRAAYSAVMVWDEEIDAAGLLCPLPVLRARKRLLAMPPGAVLRLLATDPAAVVDVPHFCAEAGHEFLGATDEGAVRAYLIRRG